MERRLGGALDYIPQSLAFQMRAFGRPGAIVAIARRGRLIHEAAFGHADAGRGKVAAVRFGGGTLLPERTLAAEMTGRYRLVGPAARP